MGIEQMKGFGAEVVTESVPDHRFDGGTLS